MAKRCFRPLTGTLLSKQNKQHLFVRQLNVSVPSRGLSYLNYKFDSNNVGAQYVSVPSRGLSYLNLQTVQKPTPKTVFPSPHGDSLI